MAKDNIAYIHKQAEIDRKAALRMKGTIASFSEESMWYPTYYEPGKKPLNLPKRNR